MIPDRDALADPLRPHMARGTHVLGGMVFVVSPHIPKLHVATMIEPKPPLVRLLLRLVPRRCRPLWYRIGAKMEEEQFIMAAGKVFCTPAGWHALTSSRQRGIVNMGTF